MTTISSSQTAVITLAAFDSISILVDRNSKGTIGFVSLANNLLSDFTISSLQSKTYGPYAAPSTATITCLAGSITYTTNVAGGGGGGGTWGTITGTLSSQSDLQTALDAKAALASPALTGTPTAPTASANTNSTQLATTAYADTGLALKAALASPALTGTPTAPTATAGTNSTQLATTAYADTAVANSVIAGLAPLNATDITSSRALTSADFGSGIIRLNAAGVIAITVPTVASMGLSATSGKLRVIAFEVLGGGIPTFAGATSSTSINGTAGTTTVLPLGGAPVTYGVYCLMQTAVGADTWTLQ